MNKKLPIFEALIDESDQDDSGMRFVSIVENPAIEIKGIKLSSDLGKLKTLKLSFQLDPYDTSDKSIKMNNFSKVDDRQLLVGPMLIPDKPIYRNDEEDGEHYIQFSADTIRKMVEKFNRNNNAKSINDDHTNKMVNAYFFSNWITEDPIMDKSKFYGYELKPGSWFGEIKILDSKYWKEEVLGKNKFSFSIEGPLYQRKTELQLSKEDDWRSDEFLNSLTLEDWKKVFSNIK